MKTKYFLLVVLFMFSLGAFVVFSQRSSTDTSEVVETASEASSELTERTLMADTKTYATPPEMQLEEGKNYKAILHTSKGDITLDLNQDTTPITVNNFVFLSQEGFYDGTRFHRIMQDFMIQGGDPISADLMSKALWGTGSPGYKFDDETFVGEYVTGTLAMANSGPNTNGSQFFIMTADTSLPKAYVIFGSVADEAGLAVLSDIAATPVTRSNLGENSLPTEDVVIESVEIIVE